MKLAGGISALMAGCTLMALTGCPNAARNESIRLMNEGVELHARKQWEQAIDKYTQATVRWSDNHSAWYYLSDAHVKKNDYQKASEAILHAVQLKPDDAMYQQQCGLVLYEKARDETRKAQAVKKTDDGKKSGEPVAADYSHAPFEDALGHLQEAVKLNNDLWRAHYMIGSIYRYQQKPKEAAAELTKALESAPIEDAPWVALAELYRAWDYPDAAIQVAQQATKVIPADNQKGKVWYEVGAGYDDKGNYAEAVKAYSEALTAQSDMKQAKFARGQAYYRLNDYTNAKKDLEAFSKNPAKGDAFFKDQAARMLAEIASKTGAASGPASTGPTSSDGKKLPPEEMVKKAAEDKKAAEKKDDKK